MRYLILSDLHANWEAIQAVLADADGKYGQILCCGDLVGYGGDPNRVTDWTRELVEHVVRGNHDKAATGSEDIEWFNPVAKRATLWTQQVLSDVNANYLRNLPRGPLQLDGLQLVHGSPLDEDDYLVSLRQATELSGYIPRLTFFGHSHLQGGFLVHRDGGRQIERVPANRSTMDFPLSEDSCFLINPGSVGQPRDGDSRAAYVIYDSEEEVVSFCRVPYDISGAQRKIIDAGLPDVLARRLTLGA